jgi:uncharacterized protein
LILIDSTIPMYLVGSPSPLKTDAQRLLERLVSDRQRLVTDAEVLQEILHRYTAINRRHDIQIAFDALLSVVDDVFPVDRPATERAKEIVLGYHRLSARDAIHLAIMEQHGIERILSFDAGFDSFPRIKRLS